MTPRGTIALIAGFALVVASGCGRYGKPVRTYDRKPVKSAPASVDSAVSVEEEREEEESARE